LPTDTERERLEAILRARRQPTTDRIRRASELLESDFLRDRRRRRPPDADPVTVGPGEPRPRPRPPAAAEAPLEPRRAAITRIDGRKGSAKDGA
jgi:hypothetical protein